VCSSVLVALSLCYFNIDRDLKCAFAKAGYKKSPVGELDYSMQLSTKSVDAFMFKGIEDFYITNIDGDTDLNNE
jgi:hypothetical protein